MLKPLWTPTQERIENSQLYKFMQWLADERDLNFPDYQSLWEWSVEDIEGFWDAVWHFYSVKSYTPYLTVLSDSKMPGAEWFSGATLNFVDQIFRHANPERPAIRFASETSSIQELSWVELKKNVASVAAHLRHLGIKSGDRVAAYSPNTPETIIAFLATASLGAIWSLCAPDMGKNSIIDRFTQFEPTILFAVTKNNFNGKEVNREDYVRELADSLPSLEHLILMPPKQINIEPIVAQKQTVSLWEDIITQDSEFKIEPVNFAHPLWVVYSSGTTGLPKPIVHSHGGIKLEQLKSGGLHGDIGPGDVYFWYTSSGWIMWNSQLGAMAAGATIAIYDGSPATDNWTVLWKFASDAKATTFGHGAAFYTSCIKAKVTPNDVADLSTIRTIGSTGSPLSEEAYEWIYKELGPDIWLAPVSGGTDFAGGFVGGCVLLPVYSGEMQCRYLGCDIHAFDEDGKPLHGDVGELVCKQPMPSMPIYFLNDENGHRYRDSYFDVYPGIWRHGDWMSLTGRNGVIIYGRSDATINRKGVRIGTSEIYAGVEAQSEVLDSLIVDLEFLGRESYMPLFVVLREGYDLDKELSERINHAIKTLTSTWFVPNDIFQVNQIPRTLSGKKLEVPIKKILLGEAAEKVANPDTIANPHALEWFVQFSKTLRFKG